MKEDAEQVEESRKGLEHLLKSEMTEKRLSELDFYKESFGELKSGGVRALFMIKPNGENQRDYFFYVSSGRGIFTRSNYEDYHSTILDIGEKTKRKG